MKENFLGLAEKYSKYSKYSKEDDMVDNQMIVTYPNFLNYVNKKNNIIKNSRADIDNTTIIIIAVVCSVVVVVVLIIVVVCVLKNKKKEEEEKKQKQSEDNIELGKNGTTPLDIFAKKPVLVTALRSDPHEPDNKKSETSYIDDTTNRTKVPNSTNLSNINNIDLDKSNNNFMQDNYDDDEISKDYDKDYKKNKENDKNKDNDKDNYYNNNSKKELPYPEPISTKLITNNNKDNNNSNSNDNKENLRGPGRKRQDNDKTKQISPEEQKMHEFRTKINKLTDNKLEIEVNIKDQINKNVHKESDMYMNRPFDNYQTENSKKADFEYESNNREAQNQTILHDNLEYFSNQQRSLPDESLYVENPEDLINTSNNHNASNSNTINSGFSSTGNGDNKNNSSNNTGNNSNNNTDKKELTDLQMKVSKAKSSHNVNKIPIEADDEIAIAQDKLKKVSTKKSEKNLDLLSMKFEVDDMEIMTDFDKTVKNHMEFEIYKEDHKKSNKKIRKVD